MIKIKRKSSIYYPIKKYYKRRIMVGDVLAGKTLYTDFPDDFINITEFDDGYADRSICEYNNNSSTALGNRIHEYLDDPSEYGIYVGATGYGETIYFYNLETNELKVNKNEYKMSDTVQNVTEVTNCQAYRHIYIKDPNIRPLKVGDALKNGTKLYFNIPDNINDLYNQYKSNANVITTRAGESQNNRVGTEEINNIISLGYYSTYKVYTLSVLDSSTTDIFKLDTTNPSIPIKNLSMYTITNQSTITNYIDYDFWSQFILVDETTL